MRELQPVTEAKWTFEIIDGPTTLDLVRIAICDLLNIEYPKIVTFRLKPHRYNWVRTKIRVEITKIEKIRKEKWIIMGDWIDAKFETHPCSFRAEYLSNPKTGNLIFSFEYGRLTILEDEYTGIKRKFSERGKNGRK